MWTLVRALIVAFALAGLVGQSDARATAQSDSQLAAAMADCADMDGMAEHEPAVPDRPCPDLTSSCMAKLGCAAPVAVLPAAPAAPVPAAASVRLRADPEGSPDEAHGVGILRPPRGRA